MKERLVLTLPIWEWASKINNINSSVTIEINLENTSFFEPHELTSIKCYIDHIRYTENIECSVITPKDFSAQNYIGRMGLLDDENYEYPYRKFKSDLFLPLTKVTSDNLTEGLAHKIQDVFKSTGAPTMTNLVISLSELLDNIVYHSQVEYNTGSGYVCAQTYINKSKPKLQVSIVDVGIGIVESFKSRKNDTRDDSEIFKTSFNELVSSTGDSHRGFGLPTFISFIQDCKGSMTVTSDKNRATINCGSEIRYSKINTAHAGTAINIEVPYVGY